MLYLNRIKSLKELYIQLLIKSCKIQQHMSQCNIIS